MSRARIAATHSALVRVPAPISPKTFEGTLHRRLFTDLTMRRHAAFATCGQRRASQAADSSEGDDLGELLSRLDECDREWPLIDGEVPGLSGVVPVGIPREDDPPLEAVPENVEVDAVDGFGCDRHRFPSGFA